jgi:hypothetical protein
MKHHKYHQNLWNEQSQSNTDWDGIVIVVVCVILVLSALAYSLVA